MKSLFVLSMLVIFFAVYPPVITQAYYEPSLKARQDSAEILRRVADSLKHFTDSQYTVNSDKMIELDLKIMAVKIIEMAKEKEKSDSTINALRYQLKTLCSKKKERYTIIYKTKKRKS